MTDDAEAYYESRCPVVRDLEREWEDEPERDWFANGLSAYDPNMPSDDG